MSKKYFPYVGTRLIVLSAFVGLVLGSCAVKEKAPVQEEPELILKAAHFSDLPGWQYDRLSDALPAIKNSCTRIVKNSPDKKFGPLDEAGVYGDWKPFCDEILIGNFSSDLALRHLIERRLMPYQVLEGDKTEGLFTGYYEASLRGSWTRSEIYNIPLHKRPDDLVMVDLGEFREELKGQRIAGRVTSGHLKPYETRQQIIDGQWMHQSGTGEEVLLWVDDAVDAFFVQIQGSGVVMMDDGSEVRIGYAGQNGHPYYAIGRELITREELTKENVSMQSIRDWLENNPDQADEIMNTNASYVFFQVSNKKGAIGGEGITLTPQRSLAIDRSKIPYGLPLWVNIESPMVEDPPLRRLMMAQDTGGAIRGAIRGDVFWGHGDYAEAMAGPMKSNGQYWILLPRKSVN